MAKKSTYKELEQRIKELEIETARLKQAEEKLHRYSRDLGERVKELNCLYGISNLVEKPDISLDEIIQGIVDLIPSSWQYPEITCSRILLEDKEYKTENFKETNWKQSSEIFVHGKRMGVLEISYLEERPEIDEGPFLKEERDLINAITERLGHIDERKHAEEALQEKQKELDIIFNSVPALIWSKNNEGKYLQVNRAYCETFGLSKEKILGRTDYDLYPAEIADQYSKYDQEIINSKKPVLGIEEHHLKASGDYGWSMTQKLPYYDAESNTVGTIGFAIDITDMKRAEETLQESKGNLDKAQKIAHIGNWSRDLKLDQAQWSDELYRIFGLTPGDPAEVSFEFRLSRIHPEDRERVASVLKEAAEKKQAFDFEFRTIPIGGSERIIRNRGEVEYDDTGAPVRLFGTDQDITKERRAQLEKTTLEKQLFQAQKMETLGALVAGVAHEINNPINLIMLNAPLLVKIWEDFLPIMKEHTAKEPDKMYGGLTRDFLIENLSKLISDMAMAAGRVAKIIVDLKNFARQSDVTEKKSVQINTAVENALRLAKSTLRKSGVAVRSHLESDLPPIKGDLQALEQIALNLIINAFQAIDHDEGRVEIVSGIKRKDERVFLSVSDNGRGIDPSISNRIFDPFFTDRQAEGGTGLGLSITHSLVKDHEGKIVFQSQKGEGTTFTVSFPTTLARRTAKILVVDDEEEVRNMVAEILTRDRPYLVDTASNGTEACIKLGTYRPDLIILDVRMPEMDGLEVCRNIRTEPELSGTKVMVITGFSKDPKVKEIQELGFDHIYLKPLKSQELLSAVDDILKRPNP